MSPRLFAQLCRRVGVSELDRLHRTRALLLAASLFGGRREVAL